LFYSCSRVDEPKRPIEIHWRYNPFMPEGLLKTKLFAPPPRPNQVPRNA
jgi:hypothetical protein